MDRGSTRELEISGMSRTNLVACLEGAAVQKGFRIIKKEFFHNSTMISAEKGSILKSMGADILTDGISRYTQSGNAYGLDADVSERGGKLRLYIAVYPRTGVCERGDLLGLMDRPILNLALDPSSDRLLEEVLDRVRARGVVLEPLQIYQDMIGLRPGEKTVDDSGWTVTRSEEIRMGASSSHDYRFWGLITGIVGFIGFIMVLIGMLSGVFKNNITLNAIFCFGIFLLLFGLPGIFLSIGSITKSRKGERKWGIISLVLSIMPVLLLIILIYFVLKFIADVLAI